MLLLPWITACFPREATGVDKIKKESVAMRSMRAEIAAQKRIARKINVVAGARDEQEEPKWLAAAALARSISSVAGFEAIRSADAAGRLPRASFLLLPAAGWCCVSLLPLRGDTGNMSLLILDPRGLQV